MTTILQQFECLRDSREKLAAWGLAANIASKGLAAAKHLPKVYSRLKPAFPLRAAKSTVVDTAKGIPEAAGALSSLARPARTFKHYRDAAGPMQGASTLKQMQSAARNVLRDTAGVSKGKKTNVVGDVARTLWNPHVPTARALGTASAVGTGTPVGAPLNAALVGSLGYGGARAAGNYVDKQPITGNPRINKLFPPEARKQFNRELYYKYLPSTLWSGIRNKNPIDRQFTKDITQHFLDTGRGVAGDFGERLREAKTHSLKSLLQKQTVGRSLTKWDEISQQPFLESVRDIKMLEGVDFSTFKNSQVYASIKGLLDTLDPGDIEGRKRLVAEVGKELLKSAYPADKVNQVRNWIRNRLSKEQAQPSSPVAELGRQAAE